MSKFQNNYLGVSNDLAENSFGERWWLGDKGGGNGGWNSNSPAISALGLLAFLFFLSLIQNSLNTSRWLLYNQLQGTTLPVNTSDIIIPNRLNRPTRLGGRSADGIADLSRSFEDLKRTERERQKRSSDWLKQHSLTSESISTQSIRQLKHPHPQESKSFDQEMPSSNVLNDTVWNWKVAFVT